MKTKYVVIGIIVFVLSIIVASISSFKAIQFKTQVKIMTSDRNMWKSVATRCFSAKPIVTVTYKPIVGQGEAIHYPKPKINPYAPPKDSINKVPETQNSVDTTCHEHFYQDTLSNETLTVAVELITDGTLRWIQYPYFKVMEKNTSTTYAPVLVHDTISVFKNRNLWGGYGGVGSNFNDPLLARAGIFAIFKTKIGFQGGIMYFHGMTHPFFGEVSVFVPFNKQIKKAK